MKVSDLFISNPVVSVQDTDLFYLSVDDGMSGWDSGAISFSNLKNNIPTIFTSDGTILSERTIEMGNKSILWKEGMNAFGDASLDLLSVIAMVHLFPDGNRPAFGIGEFEGLEARAGVFALEEGEFISGHLAGANISDPAQIRFLLGPDNADGEYIMNFYDLDGDGVIKFSAKTGGNRFEVYEDLGNLIFSIDATAGACSVGTALTPTSFNVYGNYGFNKAPQVPITETAHTAGVAYTTNEQDMIQKLWDMAFHYGLFNL